jgi:FkbM family methyltransferase
VSSIIVDRVRRLRLSQHPLERIRRSSVGRSLLRRLDVPIWARVFGVSWKVKVLLMSHATYYLLPGGPEPEIAALFVALDEVFEIRSFWDVGANFGYYGWLMASRNPGVQICMLEPDPCNIDLFVSTKLRAGLEAVQIRAEAASDAPGEAVFELDEASRHKGNILCGQAGTSRATSTSHILVPTITIDELRRQRGSVDLIKIDVEGHEEHVLHGAEETLHKDQPIIIAECFHSELPLVHMLRQCGYGVFDAEHPNESSSTATNYLALPERYLARLPELLKVRNRAASGLAVC